VEAELFHADRRTVSHDKVNSRFWKFCRSAGSVGKDATNCDSLSKVRYSTDAPTRRLVHTLCSSTNSSSQLYPRHLPLRFLVNRQQIFRPDDVRRRRQRDVISVPKGRRCSPRYYFFDIRIDALSEIHVEGVAGVARTPPQFEAQVRRAVLHRPSPRVLQHSTRGKTVVLAFSHFTSSKNLKSQKINHAFPCWRSAGKILCPEADQR